MDNFLNYFADKINPIYDQSLAAPAPVYFKNIILGEKKVRKKKVALFLNTLAWTSIKNFPQSFLNSRERTDILKYGLYHLFVSLLLSLGKMCGC